MVVGAPPPGQLLLKILVPGYAAGAIIGKGGQIIVQLQKETGAIIKLSKAKDFYPGKIVVIRSNLLLFLLLHIIAYHGHHSFSCLYTLHNRIFIYKLFCSRFLPQFLFLRKNSQQNIYLQTQYSFSTVYKSTFELGLSFSSLFIFTKCIICNHILLSSCPTA